MRIVQKIHHMFKHAMQGVHLVDRCLIVYMIVLLLQSTYSLFAHLGANSEASSIDIIMRTSAAAIFGYFLSGNFNSSSQNSEKNPQATAVSREATTGAHPLESPLEVPVAPPLVRGQIGFSIEEGSPVKGTSTAAPSTIKPTQVHRTSNRLQILIAAAVGLFCLFVLIFLRNISQFIVTKTPSNDALATVSQFRDFISGCVGFLIGCTTDSHDNEI